MESQNTPLAAGLVDPDVDLRVPGQRRELGEHPVAVLGSIAVGGVAGSLARYGLGVVFPRDPGGWPWATWGINVTGCLLIGVLMALLSEVWTGQRLLRLFLGAGVLGGFTTFSTAMLDVQQLVEEGAAGLGLLYLAGTVAAAMIAVITGSGTTRWALNVVRREGKRS
jgi:fluoride exporter